MSSEEKKRLPAVGSGEEGRGRMWFRGIRKWTRIHDLATMKTGAIERTVKEKKKDFAYGMFTLGLSEDVEKKLLKTHNENIKALNLDKSSASEAWKSLLEISDSYILEGEPLHWLGCTTYIACKSSFTPTVSKPNVVVQGNLVSLTRLLRIIDLSLIDFFLKMRKCSALLSLPDDFKDHMEKLERNFNL
ncbi:hypothetical protein GE061_010370 [Apolygus lucorum]|uniref:Retinoblastoma-associated protein N-terminal domain-containing protein n=1 Tax=Apolygus lucorum TaxID=248454 RepID=A0A8S9Y451_APOLU|nr:hypothetical protein GE061_010370 [Apolygus lucorum]